MSPRRSRRAGSVTGITCSLVKEVLTELPRPDLIFQVAVCCGDHPDIDADVRQSANPLEGLLFEEPQQLRLGPGVISPISSRNTVPPSAVSNSPRFCCRASVKATLVSEQLAFEQLFRQRRTGDVHERLGGAVAVEVNRLAARSLPVPVSPVSRTVDAGLFAIRTRSVLRRSSPARTR